MPLELSVRRALALAVPASRPSDRLDFTLPSGRRVRRSIEYRYGCHAGDPASGWSGAGAAATRPTRS